MISFILNYVYALWSRLNASLFVTNEHIEAKIHSGGGETTYVGEPFAVNEVETTASFEFFIRLPPPRFGVTKIWAGAVYGDEVGVSVPDNFVAFNTEPITANAPGCVIVRVHDPDKSHTSLFPALRYAEMRDGATTETIGHKSCLRFNPQLVESINTGLDGFVWTHVYN